MEIVTWSISEATIRVKPPRLTVEKGGSYERTNSRGMARLRIARR
jgi:hypothetical protein